MVVVVTADADQAPPLPQEAPPRPRRRGGRPPGPQEAVRAHRINARLSADEYARVQEKAAAMGMAPAEWLRHAALDRRLPSPPVPAVNVARYGELGRLAGNLNQALRLVHGGQLPAGLQPLLEALAEEVRQLRLELLGLGEHTPPGGE